MLILKFDLILLKSLIEVEIKYGCINIASYKSYNTSLVLEDYSRD
jgi:hypothetical protein